MSFISDFINYVSRRQQNVQGSTDTANRERYEATTEEVGKAKVTQLKLCTGSVRRDKVTEYPFFVCPSCGKTCRVRKEIRS